MRKCLKKQRGKRINKTIEKTFNGYINGSVDLATYLETIIKLKARKHNYETQLSGLKIDSIEKFNKSSDLEKKTYIDSAVKRMIIDLDLNIVLHIDWRDEE